MNMGNLLSASAVRNPRKTAIIIGNECLSYEQLDHSTTLLAQWLLREGCSPGDRIAVYWPNSIETVKLFFACFKAGMIAVPVNVRMKSPEIAYVLEHSKASKYFAHPELLATAMSAVAEETSRARRVALDTYNCQSS
jgi:long-chain acyl-CoA synthetase